MNRTPPEDVQKALRKEVGFGCPVEGCANPYLSWHHYDPTWKEHKHHNPEGMIALCAEHHKKADYGAYTKDQLRNLKLVSKNRNLKVQGKFDWMRNKLLAVVGGNFFYETYVIFEFRNEPAIWFNRDENGYLLLNVRMLTKSREPRISIRDNSWIEVGNPIDLKCPPSGKLLDVCYDNGDRIKIEFFEMMAMGDIIKKYNLQYYPTWDIEFPITIVEVQEKIGGVDFEFGPKQTKLPGNNIITGGFMKNCRVGISIN